ncbi:MAB_1171c family putative transporter [Streptomyces sp. NPDC058145]|uniref:MAB_1171c family putative transporter n=1 Tax=Streptomyces sp. NPDC058145 TaxID=3346356 RepID=UPI0036E27849
MTSGPSNIAYYICGGALFLTCALKVPALIRRRHDPLLRSAFMLLFAGGCIMILASREAIVTLNQASGVTNFTAPVVYAALAAYSGASLLLIIHWRPAPPEQTLRNARWCTAAYSVAVIAIFVLFGMGRTPVEQVTLFDAYYANTPYIREMIVLYLVAHGVAAIAVVVMCWRWSKDIHGSLRAGLRLLVLGYLLHVSYDASRLVAVAARWSGHNLDFLIDQVSPLFAAFSAVPGSIGFTLPLVGPRVAQNVQVIGQLRQLAPLWRLLQHVPTPGAVRAVLPWWRTSPALLLTSRKTALYDAILSLTPYCDPATRDAAYQEALRRGQDDASATASGDAAMIIAALQRQRTHPAHLGDEVPASVWRSKDLIPLSLALSSSFIQDNHARPSVSAESSRS